MEGRDRRITQELTGSKPGVCSTASKTRETLLQARQNSWQLSSDLYKCGCMPLIHLHSRMFESSRTHVGGGGERGRETLIWCKWFRNMIVSTRREHEKVINKVVLGWRLGVEGIFLTRINVMENALQIYVTGTPFRVQINKWMTTQKIFGNIW